MYLPTEAIGEAESSPAGHRETGALAGLRVLDLSGQSYQYCGKLFAQLGADVILVEPPCGSPARLEGPFLEDIPHKETSLAFAYFNQGKKGMGLDLDSIEGRQIFRKLVKTAHIVVESEKPGTMKQRGLGEPDLRALNPGLIVTSITSFGQSGPYSAYQSDDLVASALGGLLYLGGYAGGIPTSAHGNQACLAAAQFAAVATLMAVWEVESQTGDPIGQHIDVSVQECVVMALENAVQFVDLENTVRRRTGGQQKQAGTGVFPCQDGEIYLMAGGIASNRFWNAATEWLVEEGAPGAGRLREAHWNDLDYLASDEAKDYFASVFLPFAANKTKAELYADGQRRRIPICPVSTPADLPVNRQLAYRNFFQQTPHPYTGNTLLAPGAPYRLSATPWQLGPPAPRLGEHTSGIPAQLGYGKDERSVLLRAGVIA